MRSPEPPTQGAHDDESTDTNHDPPNDDPTTEPTPEPTEGGQGEDYEEWPEPSETHSESESPEPGDD